MQLNPNMRANAEKLPEFVGGTDLFLQSYYPGGLATRGFGPEECAAIHPEIVHTYVTCSHLVSVVMVGVTMVANGRWPMVRKFRPHGLWPVAWV
jgi:hypothetical protein